MYIKRNIEVRLCNHCCCRKGICLKILHASVCILPSLRLTTLSSAVYLALL